MQVLDTDPRTHAIVFDWHGVLDFTTFAGLVDRLAEEVGMSPEKVRPIVQPLLDSYTVGRIDPATFWIQIESRLGLHSNQMQGPRDYLLSVQRNETLWSLLPGWHARFKLGVLSDCPLDKLVVVRRTQDLSLFDAVHFSAEQHARKVSEEFLLGIVRALQTIPSRTLYVDDRIRNVEFARNLGFRGAPYTTLADFERRVADFTRTLSE